MVRLRGEDDLAEHVEPDVGAALLFGERFEEGEALVAALAERYRTQGPPTLLNWALMVLGYSALFQGRHDRAERLFDEAVGVTLPERTFSPNKSIQARAVFGVATGPGPCGSCAPTSRNFSTTTTCTEPAPPASSSSP